jgi:hypothetical protein
MPVIERHFRPKALIAVGPHLSKHGCVSMKLLRCKGVW